MSGTDDIRMDSDDEDWENCNDEEMMIIDSLCLFCEHRFNNPRDVFVHTKALHGFDIELLQNKHFLDCFGYIKMINYIRQKKPDSADIFNYEPGKVPWQDDTFLKPALIDDGLLQFDIEGVPIDAMPGAEKLGSCDLYPAEGVCLHKDVNVALLQRLQQAEERVRDTENQLEYAVSDIDKMRSVAQSFLLDPSSETVAGEAVIQNLKPDEDEVYFESYGHFSIHQEMLQDRVRTESYRDCIYKNKELFHNKTVLDVGCGTGILSLFAAKAGAKKVIGVDMSEVIYKAIDIARENALDDRITFVKGRIEDITLPVNQVDIIISEWMGYFLLFESMLDSLLYARERYLAADGLVLPDRCSIHLAGVDDWNTYHQNVHFWQDVYGFKMTCMKSSVIQEASVMIVDKAKVFTDSVILKEFDISSCQVRDLEFTSAFKLIAQKQGKVTALVGYFDIGFCKCYEKIFFSTGPDHQATHWKQTVFLMETPIDLAKGEVLDGELVCRKNKKDPRSLKITITIRGKTFTYLMQ